MPYLLLGLTVFTHPKPLGCIPRSTERRGWPQYHIIQTTQKARTALATVLAGCFLMDSWPCWLFVYWMYSRSYQKWSDLTPERCLSSSYLRMLCESDTCLPNFALLSLTEERPSPAPLMLSDTEPVAWPLMLFFRDERSGWTEERREIMLLNIT